MSRTQVERSRAHIGTGPRTHPASAGPRTDLARTDPASAASREQASAGSSMQRASAGFVVRRVEVTDLPALDDFFAGLSVQSRYLRFFGPLRPNPVLLRLLCAEPRDVDAVVAVRCGAIIGHAMAADAAPAPDPRDVDAARDRDAAPAKDCDVAPAKDCDAAPAKDIGIVVADAWQGRGVGAALMRALVAAVQARGVSTLAMDVLPGNRKVLDMISAHWPATRVGSSRDSITVHVRLPQPRQRPGFAPGPAAWSGREPVSRAASG